MQGEEEMATDESDTSKKKWSLEDEEEDEDDVALPPEQKADGVANDEATGEATGEVNGEADGEAKGDAEKGEKMEEEEDVDPLDAFMVAVQAEVKQINSDFQKKTGTQVSSGKSVSDDEVIICIFTE